MRKYAELSNIKSYSRRPPAASITDWLVTYNKTAVNNWRGLPDNHLVIHTAKYVPEYYKAVVFVGRKKTTRYFYGAAARRALIRYATKHGHTI